MNPTVMSSLVAVLLRGAVSSPDDQKLTNLLDFFSIPWVALAASEAGASGVVSAVGEQRFSILGTAPRFAEALQSSKALPDGMPMWMKKATSVFMYGLQDNDACTTMLRELTGDPAAQISTVDAQTLVLADDATEICGPMSGIVMQVEAGGPALVMNVHAVEGLRRLVATPRGDIFITFQRAGIRFFIAASESVIDIKQRLSTHFDVKKCFSTSAPFVMYLKWAFRDICWTARETSGCLIIDDPPLKPRYGFLDFCELLRLMDEQTFATTIAFIPWNWRRTNRHTIAAFRQNANKLSICVHGCDHIGREFATRSPDLLNSKLKTARRRMDCLFQRTALRHDPVMVFPQGAFSPEVGLALKLNGFAAAVNTEVAPATSDTNETTIADLWGVANLRYGGFPIFTRRYISDGLENFAFDGLLGKPCLLVGHHELFRDQASNLSEFIAKLNSLQWDLRWRTAGDAIAHSFSVRHVDGKTTIRMFAEQLTIDYSGFESPEITVVKPESDISAVQSITVNQANIEYQQERASLWLTLNVLSKGTAEIRCTYRDAPISAATSGPIANTMKVAARRYLSEFRDNYLSRNDFIYRTAVAAKRLLT